MLIHEYCDDGDSSAVARELANGVAVDTRHPMSDQTPLMFALSSPRASIELVRMLIEKGADVNAVAIKKSAAISKQGVEHLQKMMAELMSNCDNADRVRKALQSLAPMGEDTSVTTTTVLSLAAKSGNLEKIKVLLDAGADIGYVCSSGYTVLIDAMYGFGSDRNAQLIPVISLLILRGAKLNTVSRYGESALNVAFGFGRYDAVQALLNAGTDLAPLKWTSLMRAIALGTVSEVQAGLREKPDLAARDSSDLTPWLLSVKTGNVKKAQLLLAAGAERSARGRCGATALMIAAKHGKSEMVRWLLAERFDPNEADDFNNTPLFEAVGSGDVDCVRFLIDGGANIHHVQNGESVIQTAGTLEIMRLLIDNGADLNDINDQMRSVLTRQHYNGMITASLEDYKAAKQRRFGKTNPEKMDIPFWKAMVKCGRGAYAARQRFNDEGIKGGPVWCFQRFGKSINEMPDGRIIEIAGEHEDAYDPDFNIYNDVVVHSGNGQFEIFGYPKEIFPPTDFHTATLVGKYIYIIGSLGYPSERKVGKTQVYRLNIDSFAIEPVKTSGENPGWISRHKARLNGAGEIRISGGKICAKSDGAETYEDNSEEYVLSVANFVWKKARKAD